MYARLAARCLRAGQRACRVLRHEGEIADCSADRGGRVLGREPSRCLRVGCAGGPVRGKPDARASRSGRAEKKPAPRQARSAEFRVRLLHEIGLGTIRKHVNSGIGV